MLDATERHMRMHPRSYTRQQWWRMKKMRPVFCAKAITALSPTTLNIDQVGHHVSIVLSKGWRHYSFATEAHRDRFVELYGRYKAQACADPCP